MPHRVGIPAANQYCGSSTLRKQSMICPSLRNRERARAQLRRENLLISQVYQVLEARGAWRDFARIQKIGVEGIIPIGWRVGPNSGNVDAEVVLNVIEAHQRTHIIVIDTAPVLQVPHEIVPAPSVPTSVEVSQEWWEGSGSYRQRSPGNSVRLSLNKTRSCDRL